MSRGFLLAAALLFGCSCHRTPHPQPLAPPKPLAPAVIDPAVQYGDALVVPADAAEPLRQSVADAAKTLEGMTGAAFRVSAAPPARAIILARASSPDAPFDSARRLDGAGPEAFVLHGTDSDKFWIIANADAGLVHGLYEYLRRLGCRWLLPGDEWNIVPRRSDIRLKIDSLEKPAFQSRTFFGTGGFGHPIPIDPKLLAQQRWDDWKRRNGFGGSFVIGGHTGQAFNSAHKDVLAAHPEYLAMVAGKRSSSLGAKLCVSNRAAVKLYVEDRIAALRRDPKQFAVSVEPADGGGFCECDRCRAIGSGSPSDQVFYLANQVAKAAAKESPGARVSVLAYSEHAGLPTLRIEPNVFVVVVPEGFQRTGLSPDELLRAWAERTKPLGVHAYWAVPDRFYDVPSFDWRSTPAERIRRWHELGMSSVGLETSNGAAASGLGLYLASRLLWDPAIDEKALADEFFRLAFEKAAAPMRRMLERWADGFMLMDHELALTYRDLAEARALAGGNLEVGRRLQNFEEYVHYLRLLLAYRGAPLHSLERGEGARSVITWALRIEPTAMIASNRIQTLMIYRGDGDPRLKAEFQPGNWKTAGWQAASLPPSESELRRLMADGLATFHPLDLEMRSYSNKLVPLRRGGGPSPATPGAMRFIGVTDLEFDVPAGRSHVDFDISVSNLAKGRLPGDTVTARGPDGRVVHTEFVPPDGAHHTIAVPTPAVGRYKLHVEDQTTMFLLRPPAGIPLTLRWYASADVSPPLYFFVPRGLRRIGFFGWSAAAIQVMDADGRPVPVARSSLILADVPPGQDGRVWSLRNYKSADVIRMLNLPQSLSLAPDTLLVPDDVAQ